MLKKAKTVYHYFFQFKVFLSNFKIMKDKFLGIKIKIQTFNNFSQKTTAK